MMRKPRWISTRTAGAWVAVLAIAMLLVSLYLAGSDVMQLSSSEIRQVLASCPLLVRVFTGAIPKQALLDDPGGLAIERLYCPVIKGDAYLVWSRSGIAQPLEGLAGLYWVVPCAAGQTPPGDQPPRDAHDIWIGADPTALVPSAPPSPVIASISVDGSPIQPFHSEGDLWMSTWADDDCLYSGWGDGTGVAQHSQWTDCGIARFRGSLPDLTAQEACYDAPTQAPNVNDKPSSLLCLDGRLIGAFHSPLGDAWIGYLAYSDDHGATWTRVGFHEEGDLWPAGASPWVRDTNSAFRCLFFINMGENYSLNTDGYVYALGIGTEWSWPGPVRLARVPKEEVLDYGAYEYLAGTNDDGTPRWSTDEREAVPLPGVRTSEQGSAMFHPGVGRYLFLTNRTLYDAPDPWGPWTYAGSWGGASAPLEWQGGYQPGIISKDAGADSFWFTIAGQNAAPKIEYRLNLGRMVMTLR